MAWGRLALIHAAGEVGEVLPKMAACLSYEKVKSDGDVQEKRRTSVPQSSNMSGSGEGQNAGQPLEMPSARFLRVRRIVRKQASQDERATYLDDPDWCFTPEDRQQGGTYQFAKPEPMLPMSRLTPFLLNGLGEQRSGGRLDHRQLARRVAKGLAVHKLPFLLRQRWARRLLILVDASIRLEPYWADFERIVLQLRQQLGAEAVQAIRLDEDNRGREWLAVNWPTQERDDWFIWSVPEANVPVLILGDLGAEDRAGRARAFWQRLARRLNGRDAPVLTLNPTSASALGLRVTRQLQPNPLNDAFSLPRHPSRNGFALHDTPADLTEVFAWLSALPLVDAGLLRRLRLALNWGSSDLEGLLWNHADVQQTALGIRLRPKAAEHYQRIYQEQLAGSDKAQAFWQLVETHHRDAFKGLRQLEGLNRAVLEQTDNHEVGDYLRRLAASVSQGGRGSAQRKALQMQCRTFLASQPPQIWQSGLSDIAYDLYALAHEEDIRAGKWSEELQSGFEPARAAQRVLGKRERLETERWQIIQVGSDGEFAFRRAKDSGELQMMTIAEVESLKGLPPVLSEGSRYRVVREGEKYLIQQGFVEVAATSHQLELEAVSPFSWANQMWRDEKGLQAELVIAGKAITCLSQVTKNLSADNWRWMDNPQVSQNNVLSFDEYGLYFDLVISVRNRGLPQRFRWIEPGTFMMGSPENEPGRYNDEDMHQVTLTQGFWLADTTVIQALWQAVMGNNPSRFTDNPINPVEQVSWDDCQQFISKLNELIPGLQARLPTEAQWEYACRAGTNTAFSFGGKDDLNPDRVNYSGKWDNYDASGKTRPVKSYLPNQWGLYEMHGNVWEWCQDVWNENLGKETVIDPQGRSDSEPEAERVFRGGAWYGWGGVCRSAYRSGIGPADRSFDLGLRLSLGHELRPGAGSAGSGATVISRKGVAASVDLGSAVAEQDAEIINWAKALGISYEQMELLDELERNVIDKGEYGEYWIVEFEDFDAQERPDLRAVMDEVGADEFRSVRIDLPMQYFEEPDDEPFVEDDDSVMWWDTAAIGAVLAVLEIAEIDEERRQICFYEQKLYDACVSSYEDLIGFLSEVAEDEGYADMPRDEGEFISEIDGEHVAEQALEKFPNIRDFFLDD